MNANAAYHERMKSMGCCPTCSVHVPDGRRYCMKHRQKAHERSKKTKERHKAEGRCVSCGKPRINSKHCAEHVAKQRAYDLAYKRRRLIEPKEERTMIPKKTEHTHRKITALSIELESRTATACLHACAADGIVKSHEPPQHVRLSGAAFDAIAKALPPEMMDRIVVDHEEALVKAAAEEAAELKRAAATSSALAEEKAAHGRKAK